MDDMVGVEAVLLSDGWHEVYWHDEVSSFNWYSDSPWLSGFCFLEEVDGSSGLSICGPMTSILAVKYHEGDEATEGKR